MPPVSFDILIYVKRVLSLDASTTTVGIAVLDYDDKNITLYHNDFYKPNKDVNQLIMLKEAKLFVKDLIKTFNPDDFAIEEYIKFMKGNSAAATTIPLAIFNRTLCLAAYEEMNKLPEIISVMTIRSKIKLDKQIPKKEEVPEIVAKHLNIAFPYRTKLLKNGKEKIIAENADVADGIAVGLAFIFRNRIKK